MKRDKFRKSNIKDNTKLIWIDEKDNFGPCGCDYGAWYWSSSCKNIVKVVRETIIFKIYDKCGHGIKMKEELVSKTLNDTTFAEVMRKISFLIFDIKVKNCCVSVENWIKELNNVLSQTELGIELKFFTSKDNGITLLEEHIGKTIDVNSKELKRMFIENLMM